MNIDLDDLLISTAKPGVTAGYFGLTGKAEPIFERQYTWQQALRI